MLLEELGHVQTKVGVRRIHRFTDPEIHSSFCSQNQGQPGYYRAPARVMSSYPRSSDAFRVTTPSSLVVGLMAISWRPGARAIPSTRTSTSLFTLKRIGCCSLSSDECNSWPAYRTTTRAGATSTPSGLIRSPVTVADARLFRNVNCAHPSASRSEPFTYN